MNNNENNTNEVNKLFLNEQFRNVRKMPALFEIDRKTHKAFNKINEKSAWIFDEPAMATQKRDGTNVTLTPEGNWMIRRQVRKGKNFPKGFILAEFDPVTGSSFGLEPVENSGFHKVFKEALNNFVGQFEAGTFELVGPTISANPENLDRHMLIKHGESSIADRVPDMTQVDPSEAWDILEPIFAQFKEEGIEGIVWWGSDGKRVKLREKDFFGDPNRW